MKIAYTSYEYPPDTAFGGIATYMYQAAHAMRLQGHTVEVFCATETGEGATSVSPEGITIHRIACNNRRLFKDAVLPVFLARHAVAGFDLVESPEYNADGLRIKEYLPALPLLVKFHTPSFFVKELNKAYRAGTLKERLKQWLGIKQYVKEKDEEYIIAAMADALCAPSAAMQQVVSERWQLPAGRIAIIPNPFLPGQPLLDIDVHSFTNRVCFIGRLEVRKGIVTLVKAIPEVLEACPGTRFSFIGKSDPAPDGNGTMKEYIIQELTAYADRLEFTERVEPGAIPGRLSQADICVFPSLWEAAGYVCLEAMSAGRAVVAGHTGGMRDMLQPGDCGILVDPQNSQELAKAIIRLTSHPNLRITMGVNARKRVLDHYAGEAVAQYEAFCRQSAGPK